MRGMANATSGRSCRIARCKTKYLDPRVSAGSQGKKGHELVDGGLVHRLVPQEHAEHVHYAEEGPVVVILPRDRDAPAGRFVDGLRKAGHEAGDALLQDRNRTPKIRL